MVVPDACVRAPRGRRPAADVRRPVRESASPPVPPRRASPATRSLRWSGSCPLRLRASALEAIVLTAQPAADRGLARSRRGGGTSCTCVALRRCAARACPGAAHVHDLDLRELQVGGSRGCSASSRHLHADDRDRRSGRRSSRHATDTFRRPPHPRRGRFVGFLVLVVIGSRELIPTAPGHRPRSGPWPA